MRTFALIFTMLMHPLLMATYGCLLMFFLIGDTVYNYMTPPDTKWRITVIVFLFTFIMPLLSIFLLYRLKRVSSLMLSDPRERTFPYILTALYYLGLFYLLIEVNIWPSIKLFICSAGLAILITAFINLKTKISAHMVGLGGLLGILIAISYLIRFDLTVYYMVVIVLGGLTGAARIILGEHRPFQLLLGFLLGLSVQAGLLFAFRKLIFA